MPGLDGIALCRRIRRHAESAYTYFVMLTSSEDRHSALSAMRAGADDYLAKPFRLHEIEMRLIAAARVTEVHRTLSERTRELEDEVATAADVQRGLLPTTPPVVPGAMLGGLSIPAAAVGGDLYDFIVAPNGEIVLVIADVSGHSISSALLMAMARAIIRDRIAMGLAAHDVLEATNAAMHEDLANACLFITVFCASYDVATGSLTFASGGHNPPLVRRADGRVETLDADGLPIGVLPRVGFELGRCRLDPGDLILLYTDGVVEAGEEHGEPFGEQRLIELVAASGQMAPPRARRRDPRRGRRLRRRGLLAQGRHHRRRAARGQPSAARVARPTRTPPPGWQATSSSRRARRASASSSAPADGWSPAMPAPSSRAAMAATRLAPTVPLAPRIWCAARATVAMSPASIAAASASTPASTSTAYRPTSLAQHVVAHALDLGDDRFVEQRPCARVRAGHGALRPGPPRPAAIPGPSAPARRAAPGCEAAWPGSRPSPLRGSARAPPSSSLPSSR